MNEQERKEFCANRAQEIAEKLSKLKTPNKILVRIFFVYLAASI